MQFLIVSRFAVVIFIHDIGLRTYAGLFLYCHFEFFTVISSEVEKSIQLTFIITNYETEKVPPPGI